VLLSHYPLHTRVKDLWILANLWRMTSCIFCRCILHICFDLEAETKCESAGKHVFRESSIGLNITGLITTFIRKIIQYGKYLAEYKGNNLRFSAVWYLWCIVLYCIVFILFIQVNPCRRNTPSATSFMATVLCTVSEMCTALD
jgi:hypothetical protein